MHCWIFRLLLVASLLAWIEAGPRTLCAQPPERPKNQLGELFRKLDRGIRQGAEEFKEAKTARDQLDVRPAQRPEENRRLQQATELLAQSKWNDAIEILQYLLDQPHDSFSIDSLRQFHSLQQDADRLIGELPEDALRNYVNRYAIPAQQLLDEAVKQQNETLLIAIWSRYHHTAAGRQSLQLLAQMWQDRGEPGRSAEAWLQLLSEAADADRPAIERSSVRALVAAGRMSEARAIADGAPDHGELQDLLRQLAEPVQRSSESTAPFLPFPGAQFAATDPEPIMLPRWSRSLIERYAVRHDVELLSAELEEQGRALIPTIQPLTVNGLVACRTLRSLQVRDVATGKLQWERRLHHSPEELLTPSQDALESSGDQYQLTLDSMLEQHPLTSVLYRDQVYGSLSSDGTRLFAVEMSGEASMSAPIHIWQMQMESAGPAAPWETNELTAYDLQTGVVRWRVGGTEIEPEFSRPLAGTHFFSAPTPHDAELFVIGEQQGEVSLYCLSSQTGEPLWSQPLTTPGRPIRQDLVRGHWICQPVVSNGVVLCPTTCGWFTAVDLATHRLKWTTRYAPRLEQHQRFRGGYSVQTLEELNRRWQAPLTLVSGEKVLVTPPEIPDEMGVTAPMLCCLDLQTGKMLWEQPKADRVGGTGLYLAGIWQQQAVVVGMRNVVGRSLESGGTVTWNIALPERPAGRGLIINDVLLLPVEGMRLLKIHLKTSTIDELWMPVTDHELGNLAWHKNQLIAASYNTILALPSGEQTPAAGIEPELAIRASLREARLLLAQKDFDHVQSLLSEALQTGPLSDELRAEIVDVKRSSLAAQLREHPDQALTILEQLQQLTHTPEQIRSNQRLQADALAAAGDGPAALSAYLEILRTSPADERIADGTRQVRIDGWVGGRLQQVLRAHPSPAFEQRFEQLVRAQLASLENDPKTRDRWARALSFHRTGLELELQLADAEIAKQQPAAGLMRLLRVAQSDNSAMRPQGLAQLATALAAQGWHQDALNFWQRLQQEPETRWRDKSSRAWAAEGIAAAQQAILEQQKEPARWQSPWTLERVGVSGSERNMDSIPLIRSGFRALADLQLEQETEFERLRVENRVTGAFLASFPLRGLESLEHNPNAGARDLGSMVLVMHRGVLHALAWPDRKILWTWTPELQGQTLNRLTLVQPHLNFSLQPVQQFLTTRQFLGNRQQSGYLLAATPRVLLLLCRDWIALDPLTGEELWRDQAPDARGLAQELGPDWLVLSNRNERSIRSVLDGAPRPDQERPAANSRIVLMLEQDQILLLRAARRGSAAAVSELQRVGPAGEVRWQLELPEDVQLTMPDPQTVVWLTPQSELFLVDLQRGRKTSLGLLPAAAHNPRPQISVLSDAQRIYILADSGDAQPMYVNLQAVRFAGKILTYDRQGLLLWTYDTPMIAASASSGAPKQEAQEATASEQRHWPLNALVQDFQENPLLLLVGDRPEKRADLYFHQIRVIGLDKETGQPLVDWERPSESGGFSLLQIDPEQQVIELRTYNERLQLRPQHHWEASAGEPR